MGKKLMDIMAELKEKFVKGCLANPKFRVGEWEDEAVARELIEKIWKDWEAFASYAFNKSHSVCYAWIAYQTGYLKAHFPAEFMCAQISSEIGNFDKLPGFVAEAQEIGLELRLPDVNESGARFVPTPDSKGIRYGLGGIKGVGEAAALAIVAEREANGPYAGFMDFCLRLAGTPVVNKRVLENLTRTGAFSTIAPNRAKLFGNIEYALKRAQQSALEKKSSQINFFDMMSSGGQEKADDSQLVDLPSYSPVDELKFEREFLGVYISGHPIQSCRKFIDEVSIACIKKRAEGAKEDTLEVIPFSLDKIAVKSAPTEDAEVETAEEDIVEDDEENKEDDEVVEKVPEVDEIDKILLSAKNDEWLLKGLARSSVIAEKVIPFSDKEAFDKAVNSLKAKFKKRFQLGQLNKLLLKKIDVRMAVVLTDCAVKTPKPRPDGTPGKKWAILSVDDGKGTANIMMYAKAWEKCSAIEHEKDNLIIVCGEISHKVVYEKDDLAKLNPSVGEITFQAKEAWPLKNAVPMISECVRFRLDRDDESLREKMDSLKDLSLCHPGQIPVLLDFCFPDGTCVELSAGKDFKIFPGLEFMTSVVKFFSQKDISFNPNEIMSFAAEP
jgi:DNA polymerase III alpha subunit